MSKAHRGTGVRTEANHGRGKCPRCGTENIKVLYEKEIDGNTVKICKFCNAQLKNIAKKEARASKAAAAAAAASEAPAEA
jgi:transcription elongation factor Elf1